MKSGPQPIRLAPDGLMPISKPLCGSYSHTSRKRAIAVAAGETNCAGATIQATAFTDPQDLHTWIGGHLEKASCRGVTVWLSRYRRQVSHSTNAEWVEEWDDQKWVAYRWLATEPLTLALLNVEQERLANDPTGQLPIRPKQKMTV